MDDQIGNSSARAISRRLIEFGAALACDIKASALLINADAAGTCDTMQGVLKGQPFRTIMVTRTASARSSLGAAFPQVAIPQVHMTQAGQVKAALLIGLARGILNSRGKADCEPPAGIRREPRLVTLRGCLSF